MWNQTPSFHFWVVTSEEQKQEVLVSATGSTFTSSFCALGRAVLSWTVKWCLFFVGEKSLSAQIWMTPISDNSSCCAVRLQGHCPSCDIHEMWVGVFVWGESTARNGLKAFFKVIKGTLGYFKFLLEMLKIFLIDFVLLEDIVWLWGTSQPHALHCVFFIFHPASLWGCRPSALLCTGSSDSVPVVTLAAVTGTFMSMFSCSASFWLLFALDLSVFWPRASFFCLLFHR